MDGKREDRVGFITIKSGKKMDSGGSNLHQVSLLSFPVLSLFRLLDLYQQNG